jgi:hypothetical protein
MFGSALKTCRQLEANSKPGQPLKKVDLTAEDEAYIASIVKEVCQDGIQ